MLEVRGMTMINGFECILNSSREELIRIILENKAHEQIYKSRIKLLNESINNYANRSSDITKADISAKTIEVLTMNSILFDNAEDVIIYVKLNGGIIEANKAAVEKYGYSHAELLNMNLQQLRHPSTIKDIENQMRISALEGIVFESIHIKRDNTSFPVEVSSRTINIKGELYGVDIIRDITERKHAEDKIRYLANYDALTDIPNRGFLTREFNKTLEQAKRGKFQFAVMLFDVDKFKLINDTHGHNAGDVVLKEVAKRLEEVVRKADIVGRLGGDEFLVIQTFIKDKDDASVLADRILKSVSKPVKWNNINLNVSISIGISIYSEAPDNMEGLIRDADSAMYSIKQRGGNAYNFYIT